VSPSQMESGPVAHCSYGGAPGCESSRGRSRRNGLSGLLNKLGENQACLHHYALKRANRTTLSPRVRCTLRHRDCSCQGRLPRRRTGSWQGTPQTCWQLATQPPFIRRLPWGPKFSPATSDYRAAKGFGRLGKPERLDPMRAQGGGHRASLSRIGRARSDRIQLTRCLRKKAMVRLELTKVGGLS
jgi:hypothetical protein